MSERECVCERKRLQFHSVTRFGQILQLWRNFISLLQFFEGLLNIWQDCEPTLVTFYAIGQKFIVVKGQISRLTGFDSVPVFKTFK